MIKITTYKTAPLITSENLQTTATTNNSNNNTRILSPCQFKMRNFKQRRFMYFFLTLVFISVLLYYNLISKRNECDPFLKMKDGDQFHHTFLLAEPETCFDAYWFPKPVFLLVLIASSRDNFERRQAIRETWGSPKEIMGKNIATAFLLGEEALGSKEFSPETRDLLMEESATHHDILQADFFDTYKNLTIKTIVGMKWIYTYCSHASYFMKTDDDMYISYANIIKNLSAPSTPSTDFAMGYLFKKNMFPEKYYPPYLAGSGYILSADLAIKIYLTALYSSFVFFEDVFVGVCFQTLGVRPIGNSGFHLIHIGYEFCKYNNDVISSHGVETKEMHDIWNDLQHSKALC